MRIHHDDTQLFIHSLAHSIATDPASMENWLCAYIHYGESPVGSAPLSALENIRQEYIHLDCDIVLCSDNDFLIITKHMRTEEVRMLASHIGLLFGQDVTPQIELYDLFQDWRQIREILLTKVSEQDLGESRIGTLPMENLGDVMSLTEVFSEAKSRRKTRNPMHVLLVEDDALTRRVVSNALKNDCAIITAESAQEAICNYMLHAPDIVFLDIGLPDASGFAVLRQILESDPDAYVVMFSGNSYLDNVITALGAGASGFVAKPFKKEKLCHYIEDSALHHSKSMH